MWVGIICLSSIYLSVCLFICLSVYLSVYHLSVLYPSSIYLSIIHLSSIYLSILYLSIYHLSIYLHTYLSNVLIGSCSVAKAGLKFWGSSHPLPSASWDAETTGITTTNWTSKRGIFLFFSFSSDRDQTQGLMHSTLPLSYTPGFTGDSDIHWNWGITNIMGQD
jgi:hypothetical protein